MIYIGITGRAGSGKDTLGKMLAENLSMEFSQKAILIPFGGPLKQISLALGFKEEQIRDPVLKNDIDENWGISPREFWQICGEDLLLKHFREDCLVTAAKIKLKKIHNNRVVIFTDVRRRNEAEFILDNGGSIIEIERPDLDKAADWRKHSSENGIPENFIHMKVINNAGMDELERTAKSLAGYILCWELQRKNKSLYCSDF